MVEAETVSPLRRYGALAVAVAGVSFSAIFIRLSDSPALTIAANRMLAAVVLLLPALWLFGRAEVAALTRRDLGALALSGVFLAFHFGLWTISLEYTTVASSVVFVCTHPIFLVMTELALFGRRVTAWRGVGIALTMLGSLVIARGDVELGGQALYGDALAVGGAVAMVGYLLLGRQLRQHLSFLTYCTLVYGVCWLALSAGAVGLGVSLLDFGPRDLAIFFALAAVSTIGGHTMFNWALRHVSASLVAVTVVGEPVVAAVLAWMLLAEAIPLATAVGGALILAGIFVTARGE